MGVLKALALFLLSVMLVTSLGASNAVVATERTVLNDDFVAQQLEDAGVYGQMTDSIQKGIESDTNNTTATGGGSVGEALIDQENLTQEIVTEEYLQSQVEGVIENIYAYLHGDTDELDLTINATPIKANVVDAVGNQVRNASLAEVLQASDEDYGTTDAPVTPAMVGNMTKDQESYQAARAQFRENIRNAVLDRAADKAYDQAVADGRYDELLVLIDENPRQYSESEKQQIVSDRESEIKTELRAEIEQERGQEIDNEVDQTISDRHSTVRSQIQDSAQQDSEDVPENVSQAAVDLQLALVDGLMGDKGYEEFTTEVDDSKERLAQGSEAMVSERLDKEIPNQVGMSEELGEDEQSLQRLRNTVGFIDLLYWLLPLISLGIIGLIYLLTRSVPKTAWTAGVAGIVAGVSGWLATFVASEVVLTRVENRLSKEGNESAEAVTEAIIGVFQDVLGVLGSQSLVLAAGGGVLVVLVYAHKLGHLDGLTNRGRDQRGR